MGSTIRLLRRLALHSFVDLVATTAMIVTAIVMIRFMMTEQRPTGASRHQVPVPAQPLSLEGTPTLGSPSAKVVMVEFSDFQCPYCAKFTLETLPDLKSRYITSGQVQLAFYYFPYPYTSALSVRPRPPPARTSSICFGPCTIHSSPPRTSWRRWTSKTTPRAWDLIWPDSRCAWVGSAFGLGSGQDPGHSAAAHGHANISYRRATTRRARADLNRSVRRAANRSVRERTRCRDQEVFVNVGTFQEVYCGFDIAYAEDSDVRRRRDSMSDLYPRHAPGIV